MKPQPQTRLAVSANACVVQLQAHGLAALPGPILNLASPGGEWKLSIPRSAFPNITEAPGDQLIVSITIMRPTVEPIPEPLMDLSGPGLILPGRIN